MQYSNFDDQIKQDVFKEKTTYANDYKQHKSYNNTVQNWTRDRYEKPSKPPRKQAYADNETYVPWREGSNVPYDLLWEPKPIIRTDPYARFEKPQIRENRNDEAIKTRPRIYMSPAVSIDDVPDPEMRKILIHHMYTTDWKKACEEAAMSNTKRIPPSSTLEFGTDHVALKVELYPPLPEGWRDKGTNWDLKQSRNYVDPTKTFWVNKDPPVQCGACVNPLKHLVPKSVKNEIADLIKKDKLRTAHDVSIPGYAGYKPLLSQGVPLSKVELPVTHPLLSVTQAITKRYEKNDSN